MVSQFTQPASSWPILKRSSEYQYVINYVNIWDGIDYVTMDPKYQEITRVLYYIRISKKYEFRTTRIFGLKVCELDGSGGNRTRKYFCDGAGFRKARHRPPAPPAAKMEEENKKKQEDLFRSCDHLRLTRVAQSWSITGFMKKKKFLTGKGANESRRMESKELIEFDSW